MNALETIARRTKRGLGLSDNSFVNWLRQRRLWLEFQEANREGWLRAWRRSRIQARILNTPPMRTATSGPVEVRALTWRRDWINLIWALKSFYHFAEVDYPLYIHDGGLTPRQATQLQMHFPQATLVHAKYSDAEVARELNVRGLTLCSTYRTRNVSTRKLFDFYLFSCADTILSIDSDIVFFRRPSELLDTTSGGRVNYYNKDAAYWYSMSLDELEEAFGIRPPPLVNSGLALVWRESIDYRLIEDCLAHPKLFDDTWVTEQTLHALCSTVYGMQLLPDRYCVATTPGLSPEMVCKHYPGFFRYHLYAEGMKHLINTGFLRALHVN
jgi:hypothetical protein